MFTTVFLVTAIMLTFWFRYACSLILLSGRSRRTATIWDDAKNLHLHEIAPRLESAVHRTELLPLATTVHANYTMVTYMLQNGASFRPFGEASLECKMLYLYYRASQLMFHISNRFRTSTAHAQLCEMTHIVQHLAGRMVNQTEAVS